MFRTRKVEMDKVPRVLEQHTKRLFLMQAFSIQLFTYQSKQKLLFYSWVAAVNKLDQFIQKCTWLMCSETMFVYVYLAHVNLGKRQGYISAV